MTPEQKELEDELDAFLEACPEYDAVAYRAGFEDVRAYVTRLNLVARTPAQQLHFWLHVAAQGRVWRKRAEANQEEVEKYVRQMQVSSKAMRDARVQIERLKSRAACVECSVSDLRARLLATFEELGFARRKQS